MTILNVDTTFQKMRKNLDFLLAIFIFVSSVFINAVLHESTFHEYFQNYSSLENALQSRIKKLQQHGLKAQPLPVAVGPSLDDISQYYVSINGKLYEVKSAKAAVDLAFKSFYALQLQYPREAGLVWMLLQTEIYNIESEGDKMVPSVKTLINDLNAV